jgi:molybdate transport system substrate-binding protein
MLVATAFVGGHARAAERILTVFAPASLKTALDGLAAIRPAGNGVALRLSYAATSALARQIEHGAPADIFISADTAWMDYVEKAGLIEPVTRVVVMSNELVLIAPAATSIRVENIRSTDLASLLGPNGRLAIALTDAVPAGRYAKQSLERLGLWPQVQSRLAQTDNVRSALALVARDEAPLGIVYRSDARVESRVRVVAPLPADSHDAIRYWAAIVRGRRSSDADDFLAYLRTADARRVFTENGFVTSE